MAAALEDAGFEIRDTIAWLHGQGFPKSLDVARAIEAQADLASLGYDAVWTSLRAGDIGAPHRRERVFVLAHRPEAHDLFVAANARGQRRTERAAGTAAAARSTQP